jgi:hypothetical protein
LDVEDALPLLVGDVRETAPGDRAGRVYQDVDVPHGVERGVPELLERVAVGDVAGLFDRVDAALADLVGGPFHLLGRPGRRDDVSALLGEPECDGPSDPAGSADDGCRLASYRYRMVGVVEWYVRSVGAGTQNVSWPVWTSGPVTRR